MGQYCGGNAIQDWGNGYPQLYGDSHKLDKSISVFDIPTTFRFNYNWDLPASTSAGFPDDAGKARPNIVPGVDQFYRAGTPT
jgi:hypothetical protein